MTQPWRSDLFSASDETVIRLKPAYGQLDYFPNWVKDPDSLFKILLNRVEWQSESLIMFGREVNVPRRIAWYGNADAVYRYSGVEHIPLSWSTELARLKEIINHSFNASVNSVLCNLYRTGLDSMGWHSDNEPELGEQPDIFSISLGESRYFDYRLKADHSVKQRLDLQNGSLLVMRGKFQSYYQHQVPKQRRITQPRINLTFRNILSSK